MRASEIVQSTGRHLKWPGLDWLERLLMAGCGVCLACFSASVLADVVTREAGRPWLWLQEVTMAFFTYGIFCGAAVATRRGDHLQLSAMTEAMQGLPRTVLEVFNRLVVLGVGAAMVVYGWQNFLQGFGSFRMPSMLPIAYLYWPIPACGALVALFSLEGIVQGLRHGFAQQPDHANPPPALTGLPIPSSVIAGRACDAAIQGLPDWDRSPCSPWIAAPKPARNDGG